MISSDGRFVVFLSSATDLAAEDTNRQDDVFLHDLETGETIRVNVSSDGVQANCRSTGAIPGLPIFPSITADGRFIAFTSEAINFVENDTNNAPDVFLYDRQTGQTTPVSVDNEGMLLSGGGFAPSISADGNRIAFASFELVNGQVRNIQIFVHDIPSGETLLVSKNSEGEAVVGFSLFPVISADGRFVVFASDAQSIVDFSLTANGNIFLHDLETGDTSWVSISSAGEPADDGSLTADISANGRFIVFNSEANNLDDLGSGGNIHVFVHDRATGETERVSVNESGEPANSNSNFSPRISEDGNFVVFDTDSSNMVATDTNGLSDIYVWNRGGTVAVPTPTPSPTNTATPTLTPTPTFTPSQEQVLFHAAVGGLPADEFSLELMVSNIDALDAVFLQLEYDPSVIEEITAVRFVENQINLTAGEDFNASPGMLEFGFFVDRRSSEIITRILTVQDEFILFTIEGRLANNPGAVTQLNVVNIGGSLSSFDFLPADISIAQAPAATPTPTLTPTVTFTPTMVIETPVPTATPDVQEPMLLEPFLVYEFEQPDLASNGWSEIPGGFGGSPNGFVTVRDFANEQIPSSSDQRGLEISVRPGEVAFIHPIEAIETDGAPVLLRLTARAQGSAAALALVALKGSLVTGQNLDGSIATQIPADTQRFLDHERRLILLYEPDTSTLVTPAIQLASTSETDPVTVQIDQLEVIRLDEVNFGAEF